MVSLVICESSNVKIKRGTLMSISRGPKAPQAKSQKVLALYPEVTDKSVAAGYEAQRAAILRLYSSTQATVQETAWNGDTTYCIVLVKPLSRGSVRINATDIFSSPVIDHGTITDPSDLRH
jgi:hypothetical protein